MDKYDEKYFKELIKDYTVNINKSMITEIKKIWEETIEELVYYRQPTYYEDGHGNRTYQLRDKFKVEIKDDTILAYADTDNMNYYNSKGVVGGEQVVHWIDVGHNAGDSPFGDTDFFWNYPARHIIESFANKVKEKYPQYKIEVYRDTPPII